MPRAFRIKNLAGSVLPAEKLAAITPKLKLCLLKTLHCLPWTPCHWLTYIGTTPRCRAQSIHCEVFTQPGCRAWSACAGRSVDPLARRQFDPAIYVRQLAELKSDLRDALAEIEAHEKAIAGVVKEGSRLALNELEEGLKDLLRQVEKKKQSRRD